MIAVTLADACLRLPELISLAAKGEQVVIMQNGVVLAGLTPPPFQIPTPEEEASAAAARQKKALEGFCEMARWCAEDGIVIDENHPLWPYRDAELPAA